MEQVKQMEEENILAAFKILLLGESNVGKSSILKRFVHNSFNLHQNPTIGCDYEQKRMKIDGKVVKLSIWDSAGQERYRALTSNFYRHAHGAILVYDVTRPESFKKIESWLDELNCFIVKDIVKMIVGNKIDLERKVSTEEGLNLARKHSALFIETSAKSNRFVQSAFEELVEKIIESPHLWNQIPNDTIQLKQEAPKGTVSFCYYTFWDTCKNVYWNLRRSN